MRRLLFHCAIASLRLSTTNLYGLFGSVHDLPSWTLLLCPQGDHLGSLRLLSRWFKPDAYSQTCGEASNAGETLLKASDLRSDIALLDVPKVCQYPMSFASVGLLLSEKHTPQVNENTEEVNWNVGTAGVGRYPPKAGALRFCAVRDSD